MKQAAACGKDLRKLLGWRGPLTHRQHLTWIAWEQEQWNEPDRTDHYLMLIAATLQALPAWVWGKDCPIEISKARIPFEFKATEPEQDEQVELDPTAELEKQAKTSKAIWIGAVGGKVDIVRVNRKGERIG